VRGESDERAASFTRRTRQSHRLRPFRLDTGDYDERESTAAQKFFGATQSVLAIPRSHQNRTFFPERSRDSAKAIDPDRALTLRNGGMTSRSEHRCRSTLWHPDGEPSARQAVSWQDSIERADPRRHRLRSPVCNRCCIGKSMLDEGAKGSILIGHSSARLARTYTESKSYAVYFFETRNRYCGVEECRAQTA